jgi:hypothetical protein
MNIPRIIESETAEGFSFMPKTKSILEISPEFHVDLLGCKPNRWRRFWYWALLGWIWRDA